MKRIFFTLFLFIQIYGVHLFAQNSAGGLINQVRILDTRNISTTLNYSDVMGSPYYTGDFVKGTVFLKDGNFASFPFRYDIFRDEIEFLKEDKIYWLIKKDVKYVKYGDEEFILARAVPDTSRLGYFLLKGTGRYKLLCKKTVTYHPLVPAKGYTETVPASFKGEIDEFYLMQEGIPAQRIRNKKDLINIFRDNKTSLHFIKEEKIKVENFEDMSKLITFLNSQ